MPGTKCPTVRSDGTTSIRSALMPILMISRASMDDAPPPWSSRPSEHREREPGPITTNARIASGWSGNPIRSEHRRLWVLAPARNCAPGGDDERSELLALHRLALDEGLAALHLVGQRRLVDLDHDGVGLDAEVLHQRLGDVTHHAGLLVVGAAGGHAHGNFRHFRLSLFSCSICVRRKLDPHPEERPLGRVSKDGAIVLMVRDGARAPPHHE